MDFCFETLTLAPISKSLINIELMNKNEIDWINNYHKKVFKKLSSYLNKKEKKWLKLLLKQFKHFVFIDYFYFQGNLPSQS